MERTVANTYRRSNQGFSLTELMVAMALFLILMSGLAVMFNSAVSSARQGYASIDAFENARAAMTTIERDLSGAFVSEEFGDVYNFYGRPDSFMFVGALDGGVLGRVSYVVHPEVGKPGSTATIDEQWGFVVGNVERQFRRIAWERGIVGDAATAFANNAIAELALVYGTPALATDLVAFDVEIETESLIRYEETQFNDLNTFNMTVSPAINLVWPYVDPINPAADAPVNPFDGGAPQLEFLLSALDPSPALSNGDDLREIYDDIKLSNGWWHPVTNDRLFLRVLGREAFDTMLQSKRREFWLRMLGGEDMGVADLAPDSGNGHNGYWYDEGYQVPNATNRRVVNEFVVADGIIARATILDADGNPIQYSGVALDALDADVKFSYGDGEHGSVHYFNAIENLTTPENPDQFFDSDSNGTLDDYYPNIPTMLKTGNVANDLVIDADNALAENQLSATRSSRANMGSPLLPRLPEVVTLELWVTRSQTRPGAPVFRRRFVQGIQVPAATGRIPSTVIAKSPGQAM
jgi:prepilin-type N-terminal cleavage/methylation domain-containing protein